MKQRAFGPGTIATLKITVASVVAVFLFSVVATGGCSSTSTPNIVSSPTPTPSVRPSASPTGSPSPSPSPSPTAVNFVILSYPSIAPTTNPTYGEIQGFGQATAEPTTTPLPTVVSQVVTVHCNQTIAFYNLDRTLAHSASFLGPAAGMNWPLWNNSTASSGNTTAQFTGGQLTPITYPQFSAELLAFGTGFSKSAVYSTGPAAGAFYFGDYGQYQAIPSMRTVINILCP